MRIWAWVKSFAAMLPVIGLAGCLSSDPPKLDASDLATPDGFAGAYFATAFDESEPRAGTATIAPADGNSYLLTITEDGRAEKDAPVQLRLLRLNSGLLLAVVNDPDKAGDVLYAMVTHASDGAWVFRAVDLAANHRDRTLRDALRRHGAADVAFDSSEMQADRVSGHLTAANLRALFSDPDFVNGLSIGHGFRVSPKP
jgi:hypothetical protein